jgi:hypothetical protein
MDPENQNPDAIETPTEPVVSEPNEQATETAPVTTPTVPAGLTAEEVEQRAYAATQRALKDAQAQYNQEQELARRRATQPTQSPTWNPEANAIDALDLREDLYEEALAQLPTDATKEVRDDVRRQLRNFKTAAELSNAKNGNLHTIIADAAYGKAVREGKITTRGAAPRVEPTVSEPLAKLPSGIAAELAEIEATLGIKFSKEQMAGFAKEYSR